MKILAKEELVFHTLAVCAARRAFGLAFPPEEFLDNERAFLDWLDAGPHVVNKRSKSTLSAVSSICSAGPYESTPTGVLSFPTLTEEGRARESRGRKGLAAHSAMDT